MLRTAFKARTAIACAILTASGLARAGAAGRVELSGAGIAPESVTSTANGAIFIGSATRSIYRAGADSQTALPWAEAPSNGPRSIFGVFADERAKVVWACAGSVPATTSELYAFDLETGVLAARYPLPAKGGICNDIAVNDAGTVFATDSINMQVVRLRKGSHRLEVWAGSAPGSFGAPDGILDGIAVLGGRIFVNTLVSRKLFSIETSPDGDARKVTEVMLDRKLEGPDGMRSFGSDALLVTETGGDGALALVTVAGNRASVRTLKQGFASGAVSVTHTRGSAYVLGKRPMPAVSAGAASRFEVAAVELR